MSMIGTKDRGVGSYLKLGGQVVIWGAKSAHMVKIGLTDLQKPGWAIAHPAHLSLTPLKSMYIIVLIHHPHILIKLLK